MIDDLRNRKWLLGGPLVQSLDEIFEEASKHEGRRWIFLGRRKASDPRVIACWQLATVGAMVRDGKLRWGVLNEDYQPHQPGQSRFVRSVYGEPPAEGSDHAP